MRINMYFYGKNAMIHINLKEDDVQLLVEGRYTQAHPRVMQKYDALHLKSYNLANTKICDILGICNNTLLSFFRQYNEGGLRRLKEINFNQPESDLKSYSSSIEKYFEENPPQSISEAAAKIEALTGIKRGETQVRKFLKDMGFRFRRVGTVPAKALTEEKKTSRENFWSKI
jgi:transposase